MWVSLILSDEGHQSKDWGFPRKKQFGIKSTTQSSRCRFQINTAASALTWISRLLLTCLTEFRLASVHSPTVTWANSTKWIDRESEKQRQREREWERSKLWHGFGENSPRCARVALGTLNISAAPNYLKSPDAFAHTVSSFWNAHLLTSPCHLKDSISHLMITFSKIIFKTLTS